MNQDPRICVIGAGKLSSRCIYPYLGKAGAQLTGVCDLDAERRETNARRFGGRPYADWRVMLEEEKPDGAIICIGPEAHAGLAREILRLGYPVYTEKPPAETAAEALETARVSREAGAPCVTAFKKRYASCGQRARQLLDDPQTGGLASLSIDYGFGYAGDLPPRFFLFDFCIHAIDLACYLGGRVERAYCEALDEFAYAVSLRFVGGAVGSLHFSAGYGRIPKEELELTTRAGWSMSATNSSRWRIARGAEGVEWREPPTFISAGDSGNDTGHFAELAAWVASLRTGERLPSAIEESYASMAVYEAIAESADSGAPVEPRYGL